MEHGTTTLIFQTVFFEALKYLGGLAFTNSRIFLQQRWGLKSGEFSHNHPRSDHRRQRYGDRGQDLPRWAAVRIDGSVAAVRVAVARRGGPRRPAADLVVFVLLLLVATTRYLWKFECDFEKLA